MNDSDDRMADRKELSNQKNDLQQENQEASAPAQQQDDDEVYIGRESKLIRRAEEGNENRDRRQETEREYRRIHRR